MGWSVGYDPNWHRDIGYGVPAWCDHPDCGRKIDRGLAYVCGDEAYGGEHGCGLFFCDEHMAFEVDEHGRFDGPQRCDRCINGAPSFHPKPDHPEWINWKLTDGSWAQWRTENPARVAAMQRSVANPGVTNA